ncbi:hypothetical protein GIB67_000749 [Kingdonia uniflora]|uniref:C2H2-type domain-containing protein n=1 Tax=Kingdonia uniflora TaxID=39325 RepID=A0A7J7NDC1_9MAGN|nr:hypothetical protein GIB67_000749 [Kingdonia uniflora]
MWKLATLPGIAGMRDTNGTEPPLVSTSPTPSVLINNSVGQPLPNKILQRRKRRTRRIVKTARCEISDTACCNNHELDKQKVGKKLEKLKVQEESSSSPQEAGDTKMPVQSLRCEICDISCSSKVSLEHHDVGSKHTKMLKKLKEQQELSKNPQEAGEHRRTVPSIRCELCNITCNNTLLLDGHNVGKKHMKKLEKLNKQQLLSNSPQKANDGDAQSKTNNGNAEVVIDPQENLSSVCDDTEQQQLQKKRVISEELPGKKKRKVMKVGVPQENDERVCGMCNVTCSSQNMMDLHLAGKKHFVTLKRFCGLCNVTCNSQNMMELHLAGKKHSASLKKIHAAEATSSIHAAEDAAYSPSPHQGQVGCCMNTDH